MGAERMTRRTAVATAPDRLADGLVTYLEGLLRAPTLDAFRWAVLEVRTLIPGSTVNFNEVDPERGIAMTVAIPERLMAPETVSRYLELRDDHAAVVRIRSGGDAPIAISDVVDRETFAASALYRELFVGLGMLDQLIIPLEHPLATVSIGIGRADWGFSDGEHETARLLQRCVSAALGLQLRLEARRTSSVLTGRTLARHGATVLLSDRHGRLTDLDGDPADPGAPLGEAIRAAVGRARGATQRPVETVVEDAERGRLTVRVLPPAAGGALWPVVVLGERTAFTRDDLLDLGLTPRRAEVMALILNGETNAGAARRLGISPRTVEKHVEGAYQDLGARTRTEALVTLLRFH